MNGLNESTTLEICRKLTFPVAQVYKQKEQFKSNRLCNSRDINKNKRYGRKYKHSGRY